MALSADRNTPRRDGVQFSGDVAAAVTCYAGAIAVLDASGNLKPAVAATGLIAVGCFESFVDNAAGDAGDELATVRIGVFAYDNSADADEITAAEIGDVCYLVDDHTVAKTDGSASRSAAGVVADVDATDGVWVRFSEQTYAAPGGGLLAANNLSDLGTVATARTNLAGGANKICLPMGKVSLVGADTEVLRLVSPVAGDIDAIRSVLNVALTTGDATLTGKIGAVAITTGVITVTQAASAPGDVDVCLPSAANTVAVGDVISLTAGGTNDAVSTADVVILITPSA